MRKALLLALLLVGLAQPAWAADDFLQSSEATKKVDTKTVTSDQGTVHRQSVVVCNETSDTCAQITSGTGAAGLAVTLQNKVFGANSDNDTNATDKIPVLPCVVKAAAPSWTDGRMAPCRTRTNGSIVIDGNDTGDSNSIVRTTAGTNITNLTAVATVVRGFECLNPSTTVAGLLRIYNKSSNPVIASDTSLVVYKQLIPVADTTLIKPGGLVINFPAGMGATTSGFSLTITGVTATTDLDNDDTTNAPADIICNFRHSPATS